MVDDKHPQEDFANAHWRYSPATDLDLGVSLNPNLDPAELRLLADNLPTLCWIANGDGYIVWYNRRWHDYCGSTAAEMEGWGWQSVHDPKVLPEVMERWTACIAAGEAFEMTFPLKGADGVFRPFLTRVSPLKDSSGRVLRWFGNNIDVSAQRQVEAALRASEERLHLALSGGQSIGIWDWNVATDRVIADSRFSTFYGVDPERAKRGAPLADFFVRVPKGDLAILKAGIDAAVQTGGAFSVEYRLIQPDGEVRWVAAQGRCLMSEDGAPLRFPGVSFDITDRKLAEIALRDLNADLERKIVERALGRGITWQVSPDLLGTLNSEGFFETSNPAWMTVLGWTEAEVARQSIFELLHPDDVERTRAGFALTQIGQPAIRFPNRYRCKDGGYRWISWVGVPEDGMVYCSGRDITDEKLAEEALAATQEALRQSQKMEAVGQLTGGLAHDFNNLLTGISGNLEILQTRVAEGRLSVIDRYVSAAQGAAKRAAALTHRLLAFSRRQTLDPKSTDVDRLVSGLEDLIRRTVGPQTQIEVVGAAGLWPVLVDPNQLENALLNLCINARDAMPDGGRITIATANERIDQRASAKNDLPPGEYVSLCVTDVGTGMTPEVAARAFDPFFTTKPLGEGTGLGLSMIYGFARQSGGQIRIDTQVGAGTTMRLYLPRDTAADGAPPATAGADARRTRGQGEVVLVIDDEPTVRTLITEVLEESGYASVEAGDGASGLKVLQSTERIDLLITDVGLPGGMNGRQIADAARALRPTLKVLFITGYAENAVVGNGGLDPGMGVLTKPFAMGDLARRIRAMIDS